MQVKTQIQLSRLMLRQLAVLFELPSELSKMHVIFIEVETATGCRFTSTETQTVQANVPVKKNTRCT